MIRSTDDLERAAWQAGARLISTHIVRLRDGSTTLAGEFEFDDPWTAARLLDILAEEDADDPVVQAWARSILQATADQYGTRINDPRILDAFAAAIHNSVQGAIAFAPEVGEKFQSARTTMIEGVGDCDCHARLVHALARSQGLGSAIRYFEGDGEPVHAVDAIRGQWAETTIAAEFGEHPQEAYRRLGLAGGGSRPDIGFLGLEFVTPGNVADRKEELDGYVQTLSADVAACSNLDAATRQAWGQFAASWSTFLADKPGWIDSGAQGRQAAEFADAIRAWQAKLGPLCGSTSPTLPEVPTDPTVSIIKAGAIAVAVVAGAVVTVKLVEAFGPRRAA